MWYVFKNVSCCNAYIVKPLLNKLFILYTSTFADSTENEAQGKVISSEDVNGGGDEETAPQGKF